MSKNKIWSPCFNLKHSSSDYIERKRKQTLYSQTTILNSPTTYSRTNTYTINDEKYPVFPDYWMRRNIIDGKYVCKNITNDKYAYVTSPCEADQPELTGGTDDVLLKQFQTQMQLKKYE